MGRLFEEKLRSIGCVAHDHYVNGDDPAAAKKADAAYARIAAEIQESVLRLLAGDRHALVRRQNDADLDEVLKDAERVLEVLPVPIAGGEAHKAKEKASHARVKVKNIIDCGRCLAECGDLLRERFGPVRNVVLAVQDAGTVVRRGLYAALSPLWREADSIGCRTKTFMSAFGELEWIMKDLGSEFGHGSQPASSQGHKSGAAERN